MNIKLETARRRASSNARANLGRTALFTLAIVALLLPVLPMRSHCATVWTDNLSSGQGYWQYYTTGGTWPYYAGPVGGRSGLFNSAGSNVWWNRATNSDGTLKPNVYKLKVSGYLYSSSTTTTANRHMLWFNNSKNSGASGQCVRIGMSNATNYRFTYFTGATQTVDTGKAVAVGWHTVSLTFDSATTRVDWSVDTTNGYVTHGNFAILPAYVELGYNSASNTTAAYFDDLTLEQWYYPTTAIGAPSATWAKQGDVVNYTVTYGNYATITLAAANVTLNQSGVSGSTRTVSGSGATRTVAVTAGSGDGTVSISVAASTATSDDGASSPAQAFGPSAVFNVDNTAPSNPSAACGDGKASGEWRNTTAPTFSLGGASDGGSGLKSTATQRYRYYWGTDSGGTSDTLDDETIAPGTVTSDGTYYLRVQTQDNVGNWSATATVFTFKYDGTPPSAAAPQSTSASASSITVNFGASSGDNLSGLSATPYQVTGSDSYDSGAVAGPAVTDSSLPAAGTVVTYTVKTKDIAGNEASAATITGRVPPVDTGNAAVFSTQASTLAPPGLYPNSGKVFASSNGILYGFNSATPAQLWAPIATGGSVQGRMPVATLNSTLTVLAGSQDGKIYARNAATGAEVWTHDLGSGYKATAKPAGALTRTVTSPSYTGDVVFVATDKNDDTNFLRAIRADTGATLWTYQPGNLGPIAGAPAVKLSGTGGTVFIASQTSTATGRVAAVNIADGSELWQSQIGSVTSSVGVKDDGMKVFAVTDGGSLYSLDAATGATDGGYPLSVGTQPIYGAPFHVPNQNAVLVSCNADNAVKMVSLAGPSVSWTKALTAPSASLEYRGKVYVGSSDGKLYELNIADGTESASRTIGYTVGDPVVDAINSVLYVGANDGRIYSFSLPF